MANVCELRGGKGCSSSRVCALRTNASRCRGAMVPQSGVIEADPATTLSVPETPTVPDVPTPTPTPTPAATVTVTVPGVIGIGIKL